MDIKRYKDYLNFNNLILLVSGLILVAWGLWQVYRFRQYVFGGGVFLIGIGNMFFALTNGFTDQSPKARFLTRFGIFSYILGFGSTAYSMRHLFM